MLAFKTHRTVEWLSFQSAALLVALQPLIQRPCPQLRLTKETGQRERTGSPQELQSQRISLQVLLSTWRFATTRNES